MTIDERAVAFANLQKEIDAICHTKSTDYAGKADILANFKQIADKTGLSKFQVWAVYFEKHISAISNAIKHDPEDPSVESEPLETRVYDAINYLRLFHCLRLEDKAKRQKKKLPHAGTGILDLHNQQLQQGLANQSINSELTKDLVQLS